MKFVEFKYCVTCGRKFVLINGNKDFDMCNNCAMKEVEKIDKESKTQATSLI